MLDARFPTYTAGSRRLYEFELAGETGLLEGEIQRTASAFASSAQARVGKGLLTEAETARGEALWSAIVRDLAAASDRRPGDDVVHRHAEIRAETGVAWADKVGALRREISARRTGYEAEIAKGRLTRDQANQQLERLEAVHDLYWRMGFAFDGTRDELRAMTNPILDYDVEQQGAAVVSPAAQTAA